MTSWTDHAIWWHVYPLGFVGAPIRPEALSDNPVHRLPRLLGWLDHVLELGLNGVTLGPVFASQSHGYDTVDHFRIDPRLGDEADFDELVEAAKSRGIRVLLDGVFNHVGRPHPAFQQVQAEGPQAATASLFAIDWTGWQPGDPPQVGVFEGHDTLVNLDHDSPAVADLVVDAMNHWLDRGIDGWRLDAAYAVPPAFWSGVLPRVRQRHPQAWFTGEVIHGDATEIVEVSTMDSLTQYELWQGIWHGISDRNFYELAHSLGRHNALLDTFVPSTFIGNHDVTRIASAVGPEFVPHALAVLFTVAGVPSIYAGDEYGYTAVKEERIGGDDAVRPEFPDEPPPAEDLDPAALAILRAHQELIALRRRNPWLVRAECEVVQLENRQLVLRAANDTASVVAALSLEDHAVALPAQGTLVCGNGSLDNGTVHLPPQGWAVLESSG